MFTLRSSPWILPRLHLQTPSAIRLSIGRSRQETGPCLDDVKIIEKKFIIKEKKSRTKGYYWHIMIIEVNIEMTVQNTNSKNYYWGLILFFVFRQMKWFIDTLFPLYMIWALTPLFVFCSLVVPSIRGHLKLPEAVIIWIYFAIFCQKAKTTCRTCRESSWQIWQKERLRSQQNPKRSSQPTNEGRSSRPFCFYPFPFPHQLSRRPQRRWPRRQNTERRTEVKEEGVEGEPPNNVPSSPIIHSKDNLFPSF